jgi:hypothetical protein
MKRIALISVLASLALACATSDAQAQLFFRWRRWSNPSYSYNYRNSNTNGTVRSYRAGSYQPGMPAANTAGTPGSAVVVAPGTAPATVGAYNGGYTFNGPNVPPGPAGRNYRERFGVGYNAQYGAAPGGVGAGFGAGMGPAGSKIDAGTGTVGRP